MSNQRTMSDDDLFASLGGSLMRDLLADLSVDDGDGGWMTMEELERELAHLEKGSDSLSTGLPPTAANMVVNHQAALALNTNTGLSPVVPITSTADINNPAVDAWSLSFQKFTAASLEQDFLQADSVRKQQQQQLQQQQLAPPPSLPPGFDLSTAQEYNIDEKPRIVPPPGMIPVSPAAIAARTSSDSHPINLDEAAAKLLRQVQEDSAHDFESDASVPLTSHAQLAEDPAPLLRPFNIPRPVPATPQNSVSIIRNESPTAPTPPPSMAPTPQIVRHTDIALVAGGMSALQLPQVYPSAMPMPHPHMNAGMPMGAMPAGAGPPIILQRPQIPVAVPVGNGAPVWQQLGPHTAPPPPPQVMHYCNPHPRAPPIPAAVLTSKYMSARDIAFVVHGILRHIQAAGASTVDDYDVQYWVRRSGKGVEQAVIAQKKEEDAQAPSREQKAREWSNQHLALGHVVKTDVARPRALIAQPVVPSGEGSGDQKQRASLWKARIYVDQAYQAFGKVMELWREAAPGQIPPSMQAHLLKLLKCMGLQRTQGSSKEAHDTQSYVVTDEEAMRLLLKLDKGKVLLSRVLEQALLPPKAVQVALPVILKVLLSSNIRAKNVFDDPADSRLFGILARVIDSLPQLSAQIILQSVQVVVQEGHAAEQALSSTARMQCVHSLLKRGGIEAASDPVFAQEWNKMEETFMSILAGM